MIIRSYANVNGAPWESRDLISGEVTNGGCIHFFYATPIANGAARSAAATCRLRHFGVVKLATVAAIKTTSKQSTESEIDIKRGATRPVINSKRAVFFSCLIYSPRQITFFRARALITV